MKSLRNFIVGIGLLGVATTIGGCATGYTRGPYIDEWGNTVIFEWSTELIPNQDSNSNLNPYATFDPEKEMKDFQKQLNEIYNRQYNLAEY